MEHRVYPRYGIFLMGNSCKLPKHRVYKVPGFLYSRPNAIPPPPHPHDSVAPLPFGSKRGDTFPCVGGGGGPNSDDGTYILVL